MLCCLIFLLDTIDAVLKPCRQLALDNLALRQQLTMLNQIGEASASVVEL